MDVRIEAAPMAADAKITTPVVQVVASVLQTILALGQVVSFSRPSIGGCSLSAVSPDHNFKEELANAA